MLFSLRGEHYRLLGSALVLAFVCVQCLAGCGERPSEVAENYLSNLKTGRYSACYRMLSREDRRAQSFEEFVNNIPLAPDVDRDWFEAVEGRTEYVLASDARVHGYQAVLPVKVSSVDLSLWERALEAVYGPEDAVKEARKSLERREYPHLTYQDQFIMLKEFHRWRIFANLASYEEIFELHRRALAFYHQHELDRAIGNYKVLLKTLEHKRGTGSMGVAYRYARELALVEVARARLFEAQQYLRKIELTRVRRDMAADGEPGIFGDVTNLGDQWVDEVRITVSYYLSPDQKPVYIENHSIVANPIEFSGFATPPRPLKPGETRHFGVHLSAPVWVQERAEPRVKVSSLIFTPWSAQTLKNALFVPQLADKLWRDLFVGNQLAPARMSRSP